MASTEGFAHQAVAGSAGITARFLGTSESPETTAQLAAVHPLAVEGTPAQSVIAFNPAAVGIKAGSAQKITAEFAVSGYTGSFTPTATLHYGLDYTVGAVKCTPSGSAETCTMPVRFVPKHPGGRKDALFLMDGTSILATVLLGGTGQGPFALMEPGIVTTLISGSSFFSYSSAIDEEGNAYILSDNSSSVYSLPKGGVPTELPITGLGSPSGIALDGAGTLYIAQGTNSSILTYNTVTGAQGSVTMNPNSSCSGFDELQSVAVDDIGDLYALEIRCGQVFELEADGSYVVKAISPSITQAADLAVDTAGDVFIGGQTINEITAGGSQSEINTVGVGEDGGLEVDAASTLYVGRYSSSGGASQLAASAYGSPFFMALDPDIISDGLGLASDGKVYIGSGYDFEEVDRSSGAIDFGEQTANVASSAQPLAIYNGGNEPLTVSKTALTGSAFGLQTAATNNCSNGIVLEPGSWCQVEVTMTAPHGDTYSGKVTFTSDSLNAAGTVQTVELSGYVDGAYMVSSPKSLSFGTQTAGSTSAAKMVTLTNNGDNDSALVQTPTSSSPAFTASIGTCVALVAVGSSCELSVTFTPPAAEHYTGTITVDVNNVGGGSAPPVTFNVEGSGVNTATLTPATLTFPSTAVGKTSGAQVATLKNTGGATLKITKGGITISGADASSFTRTTTCGSTLAAGASCTVSVKFKPAATGSLAATLSVADDAAGSPQEVTLSGTGK
jgi:hypothetical protein